MKTIVRLADGTQIESPDINTSEGSKEVLENTMLTEGAFDRAFSFPVETIYTEDDSRTYNNATAIISPELMKTSVLILIE